MSQFQSKSADLLERAGQAVLELVSEQGMQPDDAIVKIAAAKRTVFFIAERTDWFYQTGMVRIWEYYINSFTLVKCVNVWC